MSLELHYRLRFDSPAFLGDADQSARWRTPPLKALLRQWWRVAYAQDHGYRVNLDDMRHAEGRLFGHAWLEDDRDADGGKTAARRSAVRLRLEEWRPGKLTSWAGLETARVHHPEAEQARHQVGPQAYLGFGALDARDGTRFDTKRRAAMQAGDEVNFSVRLNPSVDDTERLRLSRALGWIHHWGTIGGRSRNGWGSLALIPKHGTPEHAAMIDMPRRAWHQALAEPWAHAIGSDDHGPLVWTTRQDLDWRGVMTTLAKLKIGLRTSDRFSLKGSPDRAPRPAPRHWLSYPITRHAVGAWGNGARLPNTLRFKVRQLASGRFEGVVFHMPALPSVAPFKARLEDVRPVWDAAHDWLDNDPNARTLLSRLVGPATARTSTRA